MITMSGVSKLIGNTWVDESDVVPMSSGISDDFKASLKSMADSIIEYNTQQVKVPFDEQMLKLAEELNQANKQTAQFNPYCNIDMRNKAIEAIETGIITSIDNSYDPTDSSISFTINGRIYKNSTEYNTQQVKVPFDEQMLKLAEELNQANKQTADYKQRVNGDWIDDREQLKKEYERQLDEARQVIIKLTEEIQQLTKDNEEFADGLIEQEEIIEKLKAEIALLKKGTK